MRDMQWISTIKYVKTLIKHDISNSTRTVVHLKIISSILFLHFHLAIDTVLGDDTLMETFSFVT